jgi:D-beta-D-heptose 7-phosphate kinase/D-beta-D-heptose 1-phosphate adenosyltransferase
MIHDADIVVISDYNKGFLTEETLLNISRIAKMSFIDTKKPLSKWAEEFNYIKVNKKEFDNPEHDKKFINDNLNKIIVTKGEQGAILGKITVIQTRQVEVRDVSGAGDTFLAGLVAKYTNSGDIIESIKFANQCAGEAVSHKGVVSVDLSI